MEVLVKYGTKQQQVSLEWKINSVCFTVFFLRIFGWHHFWLERFGRVLPWLNQMWHLQMPPTFKVPSLPMATTTFSMAESGGFQVPWTPDAKFVFSWGRQTPQPSNTSSNRWYSYPWTCLESTSSALLLYSVLTMLQGDMLKLSSRMSMCHEITFSLERGVALK